MNCVNPGAAVLLRQYGINNYKATYAYPTPGKLMVGVGWINPGYTSGGSSAPTGFDYDLRGYTTTSATTPGYLYADQYGVLVADNAGAPSLSGVNFYSQWLNTAMMNFYLGYIPGKINANIPTGKSFLDFQISLQQLTNTGPPKIYSFMHYYNYFYATEIEVYPSRICICDI